MNYDKTFLVKLVRAKMPFGKYKNWYLTDLPVYYLEWFNRQGFPGGALGHYLSTMHEIKINGLDDLLNPIIKKER